MWQQHAIVGAATALPCENERRRALGAERECDPLARWARARLLTDSGSHGGGGGLVGGSAATLFWHFGRRAALWHYGRRVGTRSR